MGARKHLRNRRANETFSFEHEGHRYLATLGFYPDGTLGEIFLHVPGKMGSAMQATADTAAILSSLLLQEGVSAKTIRHSVTGPIAIALALYLNAFC